jgi:hypothetical protein
MLGFSSGRELKRHGLCDERDGIDKEIGDYRITP